MKSANSKTSAPKAKADDAKKLAELRAKLEVYEVVEVQRSELKNAPYNPRVLSDKARAKLKRGIKKLGLMAPPTWNARTGNIVGGHQRVSVLDDLYGTKDYVLKVAKVNLDDKAEKAANLLLNNPEAQGAWDIGKLEGLFKAGDLDIDATGFDAADVYRLFGDSPQVERDANLEALSEQLREAHKRYAELGETARKRDGADFYIVVVFKDGEDREQFLDDLGLDQNRFQDGREMRRLFRTRNDLPPAPEDDDASDDEGDDQSDD